MKNLFEWRIRNETVEWRNRLYLWDMEDYDTGMRQVVLVVEEWYIKLFSYLYSSDYQGEDRKKCEDFFYNFEGWLDMSSLGYIKVDACDIDEATKEIVECCKYNLTTNINWFKEDVRYFLENQEKNIVFAEKVYCYYK